MGSTIETLRNSGRITICYFSAGSYEDWRPDAASFTEVMLSKKMDGWNEVLISRYDTIPTNISDKYL